MKVLWLIALLACGAPNATEPSGLSPRPIVPPRMPLPTDIVPWPDSGLGRDPRPQFHQRNPPPVEMTPSQRRCPPIIPWPLPQPLLQATYVVALVESAARDADDPCKGMRI